MLFPQVNVGVHGWNRNAQRLSVKWFPTRKLLLPSTNSAKYVAIYRFSHPSVWIRYEFDLEPLLECLADEDDQVDILIDSLDMDGKGLIYLNKVHIIFLHPIVFLDNINRMSYQDSSLSLFTFLFPASWREVVCPEVYGG